MSIDGTNTVVSICPTCGTVKQGELALEFCEWKDIAGRWEEAIWHTTCEHDFVFTAGGTPETNEFTHCPYCGRKIKIDDSEMR